MYRLIGLLGDQNKSQLDISIYSAGNCYDIVKLFGRAMEQNKDFNVFLENLKEYEGSLGKVSSSGDHRFIFPTVIKEVTSTGFKVKKH